MESPSSTAAARDLARRLGGLSPLTHLSSPLSLISMLKITNLHASAGEKEILKGISLTVNAGEIHAIMGPNGSGKSTLAQVIAGHPGYEVTSGTIEYDGQDLLELEGRGAARRPASSSPSSIRSRSRA